MTDPAGRVTWTAIAAWTSMALVFLGRARPGPVAFGDEAEAAR